MDKRFLLSGLVAIAWASPALAQSASDDANSGEIIVTAQKRSESINDVPVSITAATGEALAARGVSDTADLVKIVPGLSVATAAFGLPVYTIRGVGFYEQSLAASPTVSFYTDEVPLAFPSMTRLTAFDLERVEVLKGPQGILFGQNSTGGAINQIAAKPRSEFGAGIKGEVGRFNYFSAEAYLTGALAPDLNARLALRGVRQGNWQESTTRDDEMGKKKQFSGRFLLDWQASDAIKVALNFNGWIDKSDTQASQIQLTAQVGNPASCTPTSPNYPDNCVRPAVAATPRPTGARGADWNPNVNWKRDDYMYQGSMRIDADMSDSLTLNSISAYSRYQQRQLVDQDGTALRVAEGPVNGDIKSLFQELRLTSSGQSPLQFIIGANYSKDEVDNTLGGRVPGSIAGFAVADGSSRAGISKTLPILAAAPRGHSDIDTYAVFGNATYQLTDTLKLQAGIRYTDVKTRYRGCNADAGDGSQAAAYNFLIGRLTGTPGNIQPGGCNSVDIERTPAGLVVTPREVQKELHEDNVSWKVGVDFKPNPDTLLYASVSRGYKSGSFPVLTAATNVQIVAATQESILAYEVGSKLSLADRKVQLNLAAFYYDYSDKQVLGRILEEFGIFGALQTLVNVPKSRLYGAEAQLVVRPVDGLTFDVSGTYLKSKVTGSFKNYDPFGNVIDFKGQEYPFTPEFSAVGDVAYEWGVSDSLNAFVGASFRYQTETTTVFRIPGILANQIRDPLNNPGAKVPGDAFDIGSYGTVDLRAGLAGGDKQWRATAYVRNVGDKYYVNNIQRAGDGIVAFAAMPRTYGLSFSYNF